MTRNPMIAVGFAAAMAFAASAALAQMNEPGRTQTSPSRGGTQMNEPQGGNMMQGGNTMNETRASKADRTFITEAIRGDLAEVEVGKLAQEKGGSADVKQFGKMLEQDHGQHLSQAQAMAQQLGVTAPSAPSAKQKAIYDRLSRLSGAQFDRQFKQDAVKDHRQDIAEFEKEAKSKGPLAGFAQQTLPTLRKHLQTAERLPSGAATTGAK